MNFDISLLRKDERIIYSLRSLFMKYGYSPYKMSRFEEYDFYARNKDFLVSDGIITFTDTNGRLMALKPDVTLSVIKSSRDEPNLVQKLYYNENVFRATGSSGEFRELMQIGIECIGDLSPSNITEVVRIAGLSMLEISKGSVLSVSHMGVISTIADYPQMPEESRLELIKGIKRKNADEISSVCRREKLGEDITDALCALSLLYSPLDSAMESIRKILAPANLEEKIPGLSEALLELENLINDLKDDETAGIYRIDFSVTGDVSYYNGIVFAGFISGIPQNVLTGGRYDRLMKRIGRSSRGVGFAIYQNMLEGLEEETAPEEDGGFLNIALPKGRLGEEVYGMFAAAGFECPQILENNRKLIFENPEAKVRYFWAKPSDVQIYVERGTADIGVCGRDILLEYKPDVYELLDLGIGKCRMCVAAPEGYTDDAQRTLKVATKFSEIARTYYSSLDRDIDIIHLNGSIEIAPILGLSDVIVDIVETGTTLRENRLSVLETIVPISARLIANKSAYSFKSAKINEVRSKISGIIRGKQT